MEPLNPQDPLWKLLGQSRSVEPRPDFVRNVVRAAQQTPQDRGWTARIRDWFQESRLPTGIAWAAAVVLLSATAFWFHERDATPSLAHQPAAVGLPNTEEFPLLPELETEWANLEQMGDLLVVNDTTLLTDAELNLLLY